MNPSLPTLKALFADRPDVLALFDRRELDLQGLTDAELVRSYRTRQLYPEPINLYVTGRTGAGKSSLGNRFLEGSPLRSTGHVDCTAVVQYVRLASNLVYFDLPGAGSDESFENINRAAVVMPQIKDEPPADAVPILDLTAALAAGQTPSLKDAARVPLAEWAGEKCRQQFTPDVVLYVIAPHNQWIRPDRVYLEDLLKGRKAAGLPANVVFAINGHLNPDGSPKATGPQMTDVRVKVKKGWEEVYPGVPLEMIEVNSLTGVGMQALAEALCRVLPANKIGNMEQVLSSDLKKAAAAERSRRYRGLLLAVAGRLATFRVDATAGREELLAEAFAAIARYGMTVFHQEAAVLDAQREALAGEWEEVAQVAVSTAADAKQAKASDITVTKDEVKYKEEKETKLVGQKPIIRTDEVEDVQYGTELHEERRPRALPTRVVAGLLEGLSHVFAAPISAFQMATGKKRTENHIVREQNRDSYSYVERTLRPTTQTVTRYEERLVGFEDITEEVTKMVPHVVQTQQKVGTGYSTGGSRVIEDVFALGLAAEGMPPGSDVKAGFAAAFATARRDVQAKLAPLAAALDAASADPDPAAGEQKLVALLRPVFLP